MKKLIFQNQLRYEPLQFEESFSTDVLSLLYSSGSTETSVLPVSGQSNISHSYFPSGSYRMVAGKMFRILDEIGPTEPTDNE